MPIESVTLRQKNDDGKEFDVKITGQQFSYILYDIQDFGSLYRFLKGNAEWIEVDK